MRTINHAHFSRTELTRLSIGLFTSLALLLPACAPIGTYNGTDQPPASQLTEAAAPSPITAPPLPAILQAEAEIVRSERDGHWEKTLLIRFPQRRTTLSTSDGLVNAAAVANHAASPALWASLPGDEGRAYLDRVQARMATRLGVRTDDVVKTGTAADMDNLSFVTLKQGPFMVAALVTAGAKTNALRAGTDMSDYVEGQEPRGTINIILLTNARLSVGAMAQAMVVLTEGKTAALEDLKVPSSYTKNAQATGTGTDSIIVVSGASDQSAPHATYVGGHSMLGSLIGKAAYVAVVDALGKQNGFFLPQKQAQ